MLQAARAELLRRLDHNGEAAPAYEAALPRTENASEREFLERRRQALNQG